MFEYLITRPLGWIINLIYSLVANYGWSIIIFTIVIKMILMPLQVKSQKAMKKQQKIQPIMAELQKKYANDQEKLQRETMKLYKNNNISMTGGCLPLLIQMPILVGLYRVIQWPLNYLVGVDWASADAINKVYALRDAMAAQHPDIIGNLASYDMNALHNTAQIQLSKWSTMINGSGDPWALNFDFLGLDISNTPMTAIQQMMAGNFGNLSVILLLLIPIFAVLLTFLSMKISQAQTQGKDKDGKKIEQEGQAAQMSKTMNMMMPIMTGFFTISLPAGMGLYWIISSLVQIGQQVFLNYYFDKKGGDFNVTIPENKNRKNGKKRK